MAIAVKRTAAPEYQDRLKVVVLGHAGAGKTLFSSTWPDPLFLSAEAGLLSVRDRNVPFIDIHSREELDQVRLALDQEPHVREGILGVPVQTVVLDTIDEIQRILMKERVSEKRADAMAMADWGWIGDQMRSIVRAFRNLDLNVVITCHLKESTDSESGKVSVLPQLQGAFQDELAQMLDLVLLLRAFPKQETKDGQTLRSTGRVIQTFPDGRHDWVKDRSGKLPPEFEVNFKDDYARIAKAVFGDVKPKPEPKAKPPAAKPPAKQQATKTPPAPDHAPDGKATPTSSGAADSVGDASKSSQEPAAAPTAEEGAQPSDETELEPTPETEAPEAQPEHEPPAAEPEPESDTEPESESEQEPEPESSSEEEVVADSATEAEGPEPADDDHGPWPCENCKTPVDEEMKVLSQMRYRKTLCRPCFVMAKGTEPADEKAEKAEQAS